MLSVCGLIGLRKYEVIAVDNMDWLSEILDESLPRWRNDPVQFFREVLTFEPDDWQIAAAADIKNHNRVAVKSGQGVGKTAFEAAVFLWFISCFYNARIVCTAPTKQQLHDVLWSEVAKWMNESPLLRMLLKWTKTYVYVKGYEKRWFAVARTATKPENMQGFHEDNSSSSRMLYMMLQYRIKQGFFHVA